MPQPRTAPAGYGPAPADEPLSYPGTLPLRSTLMVDDSLLALHARTRRRLPQWRVELGEHRLPGPGRHADELPLGYVLLRHNQTPMGPRFPLLAAGSDASPARLWQTFREQDASQVLPMVLAAEVRNLAIGVSAHIDMPGYVPATPIVAPGTMSRLFVLWPDRSQLAALDHSEPHYHRVLLPGGAFPVVLPSGEHLAHSYVYVSRHGHLCGADGGPLVMPDAAANGASRRPEHDLLRDLLARDDDLRELLGPDPASFVRRAAARPAVREIARQLFRARNWVGQSPELEAPIAAAWGTTERAGRAQLIGYDDAPPAHPAPANALRVLPLPEHADRRGEATVRVPSAVAEGLGHRHVLVTSVPVGERHRPRVTAVARLMPHPELEDTTTEVDPVIRAAIGVEVGEDVELVPVAVRHNRFLDGVLGPPRIVCCRVQPAETITAERQVCLLDALALDLLGVRSGNDILVDGTATLAGVINRIRITALRIGDGPRHRHETLQGGDFGHRLPSALDALGVFPDLPWIFLDSATRLALGVDSPPLATVRVRPPRRFRLR